MSGSFRVDLRAHGIDIPSYRGITVRPEVDVEVAFGGIDRAVIADAMSPAAATRGQLVEVRL